MHRSLFDANMRRLAEDMLNRLALMPEAEFRARLAVINGTANGRRAGDKDE